MKIKYFIHSFIYIFICLSLCYFYDNNNLTTFQLISYIIIFIFFFYLIFLFFNFVKHRKVSSNSLTNINETYNLKVSKDNNISNNILKMLLWKYPELGIDMSDGDTPNIVYIKNKIISIRNKSNYTIYKSTGGWRWGTEGIPDVLKNNIVDYEKEVIAYYNSIGLNINRNGLRSPEMIMHTVALVNFSKNKWITFNYSIEELSNLFEYRINLLRSRLLSIYNLSLEEIDFIEQEYRSNFNKLGPSEFMDKFGYFEFEPIEVCDIKEGELWYHLNKDRFGLSYKSISDKLSSLYKNKILENERIIRMFDTKPGYLEYFNLFIFFIIFIIAFIVSLSFCENVFTNHPETNNSYLNFQSFSFILSHYIFQQMAFTIDSIPILDIMDGFNFNFDKYYHPLNNTELTFYNYIESFYFFVFSNYFYNLIHFIGFGAMHFAAFYMIFDSTHESNDIEEYLSNAGFGYYTKDSLHDEGWLYDEEEYFGLLEEDEYDDLEYDEDIDHDSDDLFDFLYGIDEFHGIYPTYYFTKDFDNINNDFYYNKLGDFYCTVSSDLDKFLAEEFTFDFNEDKEEIKNRFMSELRKSQNIEILEYWKKNDEKKDSEEEDAVNMDIKKRLYLEYKLDLEKNFISIPEEDEEYHGWIFPLEDEEFEEYIEYYDELMTFYDYRVDLWDTYERELALSSYPNPEEEESLESEPYETVVESNNTRNNLYRILWYWIFLLHIVLIIWGFSLIPNPHNGFAHYCSYFMPFSIVWWVADLMETGGLFCWSQVTESSVSWFQLDDRGILTGGRYLLYIYSWLLPILVFIERFFSFFSLVFDLNFFYKFYVIYLYDFSFLFNDFFFYIY
jgi:hypothetical protein